MITLVPSKPRESFSHFPPLGRFAIRVLRQAVAVSVTLKIKGMQIFFSIHCIVGSIRLPRRRSRRTKITSVALICTQSSLHPSTFIDEFIPRVIIRNCNEALSLLAGTIFDCSHFGSDCTIVFILKQKINFLDHAINSWLNENCI